MESKRTVNHSDKSVLRQQMRTAKQQYAEQLPAMSAAIIKQLRQRLDGCHTVMAYWPLPDEVDIRPLIDDLVKDGYAIILPKVLDDNTMELRRYS